MLHVQITSFCERTINVLTVLNRVHCQLLNICIRVAALSHSQSFKGVANNVPTV